MPNTQHSKPVFKTHRTKNNNKKKTHTHIHAHAKHSDTHTHTHTHTNSHPHKQAHKQAQAQTQPQSHIQQKIQHKDLDQKAKKLNKSTHGRTQTRSTKPESTNTKNHITRIKPRQLNVPNEKLITHHTKARTIGKSKHQQTKSSHHPYPKA